MRRGLPIFLAACVLFIAPFLLPWQQSVRADEIEDLQRQIDDLERLKDQSEAATEPLEEELENLEQRIDNARAGIEAAKQQIQQREEDVAVQYTLLANRVAQQYKRSRTLSPLMLLFTSSTASDLTKNLAYSSSVQAQDNRMIRTFSEEISKLEKDQETLAALEIKLEEQAEFFAGEIAEARAYQRNLSSQIASLNAQQQQLIAQRQASLNLPSSLGAGPLHCTDDRNLNPGFGNAYAFFTFGIPHRVGMSQYGANGRANAGQGHEQILQAYFANFSFENRSARLKVQGYGEMDLEEYLLGIYEMPNSFHIEALKAQAISARSYALSYTNNGEKEICTTQACQVYKGGNKGGAWEQAVKETAGKTMISGGQPITAWYASTAGGYTFTNSDVWGGSQRAWTKRTRDTTGDVSSFGDLQERAYDKGSPCLYSAQGYRGQYGNSAWLKGEELADIVNVILLARADGSTKDHLYQTDKPHPYGGEIWDEGRVRQELQNRGGSPLTNVSSASISGVDWGSGLTTQVTVDGRTFSGNEFRDWFNLRAPANIQIVGPLFNIERK